MAKRQKKRFRFFRKRTGNGTSATQHLYCMVNFPFIWVWKIGIGGSAWERASTLSKEVWGIMIPVAVVNIPFAYQIEQGLLSLTARLHVNFCGKTETRLFIAGVPVAIFIWILIIVKWSLFVGSIVLFCYYSTTQ